jgi:hypothetical protein
MTTENKTLQPTEPAIAVEPVLAAGWISIETQMPPLNENVLVFDDFHRMNICKRMDEVGYKIWNTESIIIGITHWMQLPSKPACS